MKKFLTAIIINLLIISSSQATAQVTSALWKGVGGKTKWDSTNYILFTANGSANEYLESARKFLINKKSGQIRFEGRSTDGNHVVALFNFKSFKLSRLFRSGEELKPVNPETTELFSQISKQFKLDVSLIFLPILLNQPDTKTGQVSSKIVNAEKLQAFTFELKDNTLSGEILFSGETGQIKQIIDQSGNQYFVNDYKDIGGGLILPTTFKSMSNQDKNATFTTVAAFTEMEDSKFTSL